MVDESHIFEDLEKESSKAGQKDLDKVLSNAEKVKKKSERLSLGKNFRLFKQVSLAYEMIKDYRSGAFTSIPWKTIAQITVAVLYFLNPFDIIPDFIPFVGYADDALVLTAVFKAVQVDLKNYCIWKNYIVEDYF